MDKEFYTDAHGKKSGKRLYGSIMVCVGILMFTVLYTVSLFKVIADPETAKYCAFTLIGFGSGLLGFGVFEQMSLKKKTDVQSVPSMPEIGG